MAAIKAQFETRRQAEMAIERMVQEHHVDRKAITVTAAGQANTTGTERAGSDAAAGADNEASERTQGPREDAPLAGAVLVTIAYDNADTEAAAHSAFAEFAARQIVD
jgi:hypothetical protein